jgi:hypothetical protein
MSKNNIIRQTVQAKPGSILEKVVERVLTDAKANSKRLQENYKKKVEKQQKKI